MGFATTVKVVTGLVMIFSPGLVCNGFYVWAWRLFCLKMVHLSGAVLVAVVALFGPGSFAGGQLLKNSAIMAEVSPVAGLTKITPPYANGFAIAVANDTFSVSVMVPGGSPVSLSPMSCKAPASLDGNATLATCSPAVIFTQLTHTTHADLSTHYF